MDVRPAGLDPVLSTGQDPILSLVLDSVVPSTLVVGLLNSVSPSEKVLVVASDPPVS